MNGRSQRGARYSSMVEGEGIPAELFRRRFDDGTHATLAAGDAPIASEAVDLVALEFRTLERCGVDNDPPGLVHLAGKLKRRFGRPPKQLAQHADDVIIGMVVIVEKNDVVRGQVLAFGCFAGIRFGFDL